ncbi:formate/nitrite transporter family protein [Candidatus Saccharibacteria bacterium]|nr:formate/nitrite transporter family protein [Candidatus Saccharibacteria bacterium]
MFALIKKSLAAALLIGLGNYALLKLGSPIGPVIFAFGLLGVCYLELNLFTGKCGFLFESRLKLTDLLFILLFNLVGGYLFGLLFRLADPSLAEPALEKIASWDFSIAFFVRSFLCGVIMYLAVKMYKKGTPLGIIFGIPLFIFCGFQHCIANVITLGVGVAFSWSLVLAILGNFLGSLFMSFLSQEPNSTTNSKIAKPETAAVSQQKSLKKSKR